MPKNPRVFISSCVDTLRSERKVARRVLSENFGFDVFASEYEGANSGTSWNTCKTNLELSDFVIIIIGEKYGFRPRKKEYPFDGRTSVSKGEFILAKRWTKPLLVYVKSCKTYEKKQQIFLDEIKEFYEGYFISEFDKKEELEQRLKKDVPALLAQMIRYEYQPPAGKVPFIIRCETARDVFDVGARAIEWVLDNSRAPSILLSGGNTGTGIFERFITTYFRGGLVDKATFFTNFEYLGVSSDNKFSRHKYFYDSFFARIEKLENKKFTGRGNQVHYVPGVLKDGTLGDACQGYDRLLKNHRPVLGLLSMSPSGEFAGICPDRHQGKDLSKQKTTAIEVSESTFSYLQPSPQVPSLVTVGAANLLDNVQNLMISLTGKAKAKVFKKLLYTKRDLAFSPSILREHNNLILVVDKDAASNSVSNYPPERIARFDELDISILFERRKAEV